MMRWSPAGSPAPGGRLPWSLNAAPGPRCASRRYGPPARGSAAIAPALDLERGRSRRMTDADESVTLPALLARWSAGDRSAFDRIVTLLYRDIHQIAVRELSHERRLTIRPTALVHEAYLRLGQLSEMDWQDRAHFLSMAARVTRQAIVDEARRRQAVKRDGTPVTLNDAHLGAADAAYDALEVDELLTELDSYDHVTAEVVALRVFGGLAIEEVATALGISVATVNRRWAAGKAWLASELSGEP